MAIYYPDMERETFREAVSDAPIATARTALRTAVQRALRGGMDRGHLLGVLDRLADDYAEQGETDHENAVLDVMDAVGGWIRPARRL
jgi:hypothetical protein